MRHGLSTAVHTVSPVIKGIRNFTLCCSQASHDSTPSQSVSPVQPSPSPTTIYSYSTFFVFPFLLTAFVLRVLLSSYVYLFYLMCICCTLYVCVVSYVYLYYVCIAILTLDAGLLARSQYPEGPTTGNLDTGFSWFPCVYKRILSWFPSFQVATTCFSFSPPDLNFLVNFFFCIFVYM